jgi:hypothetical protein
LNDFGGRLFSRGRSALFAPAPASRERAPANLFALRFLSNRVRGSSCVPPGRQSAPRFSPNPPAFFAAHSACSGESHSLPREKYRSATSSFFRRNWFSVGSSSSDSFARNAVALPSIRIVQYA